MTETERTLRLIKTAAAAWGRQDIDAFMRLVDPEVIWTINMNSSLGPTSETVHGITAVRRKAEAFKDMFEFKVFDVFAFDAEQHIGRWHVKTRYRHRATNEILETRFKVVFERTGERLTMIEEFVDQNYIEAFLRLVGPDAAPRA